MAYSSQLKYLATSIPADEDYTSDPIEMNAADMAAFEVKYSGLDADDAEISIEVSVTKICWCALGDSIKILDSAESCQATSDTIEPFLWMRFSYSKGSVTAGTIDHIAVGLKSRK